MRSCRTPRARPAARTTAVRSSTWPEDASGAAQCRPRPSRDEDSPEAVADAGTTPACASPSRNLPRRSTVNPANVASLTGRAV
jgi:hypothetical protein